MQQLQLFGRTQQKPLSPDTKFNFQDTLSPRRRQIEHMEQIQPWLENTDNPFLNYRENKQNKKGTLKVMRLRESVSPPKQWRSTDRIHVNRQSKILPVMDIGKLNSIRKASYSTTKVKSKMQFDLFHPSRIESKLLISSQLLPNVKKELLIERKLFLMKSTSQNSSPYSSPERKSRIRNIISQARR